ncbi:MAG TPA: hypothetical protein PKV48_08030, partial [Thermodesulfobacteriota bacterium]|nr:hypothetical protein [Thermodesulfobacteriota bacterium]
MIITKYKIKLPLILASFFLGLSLGSFCYGQEAEQPISPPGETTQATEETTPDRPTVNINTSLYSKYVWRGYELSKDSFVMFPQL